MKLEEKVVDYIKKVGGGVSFVEISQMDEGPDKTYSLELYDNLIVWPTLSEEMSKALQNLIATRRVQINPTPILTYFIDGAVPDFPLAKRAKSYKAPRWLPTVVNLL